MGRGSSIKVGELVPLILNGRRVIAEIVEDRGHLGPGGQRVLRIAWPSDPSDIDERHEFELAEHDFDELVAN